MTPSPRIDASVARDLARVALAPDAGTVVYVDCVPRGPGPVTAGPDTVHLERPALVVFRDEMPGANWMHPCTYALVEVETGDVVMRAAADRPPQFGWLPDNWVVAADPDGRADLVAPGHNLVEDS
jgi:hypothetical protein